MKYISATILLAALFVSASVVNAAPFNFYYNTVQQNCTLDGAVVQNGESRRFYKVDVISYTRNCADMDQVRKCTNGKLSGNDDFKKKDCRKAPRSQDAAAKEKAILLSDTSSYVWSTQIPHRWIVSKGRDINGNKIFLRGPNVNIRYRAVVKDATTNEVVTCGSSVSKGTRLKLEFVPHVYQDIYWFTAGTNYDSPYGAWSNNATPPPISCSAKDLAGDDFTYAQSHIDAYVYAALQVDPPNKSISGTSLFTNCTNTANDSKTCTASAVGTANIKFTFGSTFGKFYPRVKQIRTDGADFTASYEKYNNKCVGDQDPMEYNDAGDSFNEAKNFPYKLNIPKYDLSCPITVTENDPNNHTPTIANFSATGVCTTGTAFRFSVTSADTDAGAKVKYIFDWGHPGSGNTWVNDGTETTTTGLLTPGTYTTARTYAQPGSRTVKVKAIDNNNAASSTISLTFSCGRPDDSAVAGGDETASRDSGDGGAAEADALGGDSLVPDLVIRATPSLIYDGDKTRVSWSAQHVDSCTVTAQNGDSWTGLTSATGGMETKVISLETVYTLTCLKNGTPYTKAVTVRINPSRNEN